MAFTPNKPLLDMYVVKGAILGNSITVSVGDAVIIKTSAPQFVIGAANTTGVVLGTVLTIHNGPASGSTYLQLQTVTTASNNQTVGLVNVDILVCNNITTFTAQLDANAGTTTNSQYFGYFNLSTSNNGLLQESSYNAVEQTTSQFLSYGLIPGSSNLVQGVWTKVAIG